MEFLIAFCVGGVICALTQILMDKTKMMPGRIMVLLVCLGVVLGACRYMNPFQNGREQGLMFRYLDLEMPCGRE